MPSPQAAGEAARPLPPAIELRDVSVAYGAVLALDGVTLTIPAGQHVCVLGSNGSGKSTMLQLMNALALPTSGRVLVHGRDTAEAGGALAVRREAAMVFQHPEDQMVASIVADDVAFGPENLGVPADQIARRVDAALDAVDMAALAGADPADLSGGQKQRVAIAGALAMEPRVLLLDEPSAMLDAEGHAAILRIAEGLRGRGITIVHVTHFMEDAQLADRVVVMRGGRVAMDGAPAEVFARARELAALGLELPFDTRVEVALEQRGSRAGTASAPRSDTGTASPAPQPDPADAVTPRPGSALAFEDVSFSYAPGAAPALDGVSLSLEPGTLCALIGRTGAGKSTAVELACALKAPSAGTVRIGGIDAADRSRRQQVRAQVGYVSQLPERQLFAATVYEDVAFGPRNLGLPEDEVRQRVGAALSTCGLDPTDELLARPPFALSGGQQRSVALAGVLAMRQRVLVLDEPMAGLDPTGRARLRRLLTQLKRGGTALLLVTHSMDDVAELADSAVVLDDGRVVAQGTPREVFCPADGGPTRAPGIPSALSYARERGITGDPLTLAELLDLVKVGAHGAAR